MNVYTKKQAQQLEVTKQELKRIKSDRVCVIRRAIEDALLDRKMESILCKY